MPTYDNVVNFPASFDICVGGEKGLGILVKDENDAPVNCSTFAMLWELFDVNGVRVVSKLKSIAGQIDVTNGDGTSDLVTPRLVDTDTVTAPAPGVLIVPPGRYTHELWRIDEGATEIRLARGYVELQPSHRRQEVT